MSRTSKTLLRLGVPSLAAATMIGGIPLFLGAAQAAAVASLAINPVEDNSAAAGSCLPFVITGTGTSSTASTVGEKVNVIVTDAAGSASSDVSFCTLPTTTGDTDTTQGNETTFTPAAGTTISSGAAQTGGGSVDQAQFTLGANQTGNNAAGTTTGASTSGEVVIGITRNEATTSGSPVNIRVYQDLNGNNTFDAAANEVQTTTTAIFTAGGPNGSNANQNAVTTLDARQSVEDNSGTDAGFAAESRSFRVLASNGTDAVEGATVNYQITNNVGGAVVSGPSTFGVTDNDGLATGSITLPATGNYTITFYVNQSDNATAPAGGTAGNTTTGPDTNEPTDTITEAVAAAQAASTVDVIALPDANQTTSNAAAGDPNAAYQTAPAINPRTDGNRTFRIRTDNGSSTSGNVAVTVTVSGGDGDETVTFPTAGGSDSGRTADGSTAALDTTTTGSTTDTFVDVVVNDPDAPNVPAGQVLTVTAVVRGQSASDSETLTYVAVPADARNVTLTPTTATTAPGSARTFTATVVDATGKPVVGVPVTFTESGPGAFRNGSSTAGPIVTDRNGQASTEVIALQGESGTQTITATIPSSGNNTAQAAGTPTGTTTAGNSTVTATNVIGTASPTATPSSTATATTGPTPTPTVTTGTPTPTQTATTPVLTPLSLSVAKDTIVPTEQGVITATGAPNQAIELLAYSRPNTTYSVVRSGSLGADGTAVFRILPGTNTRLYARYLNVPNSDSASVVQNVATSLSISTVRNGTRNYTFQGRLLPRRAGQLVTLYRVDGAGREIITQQIRSDASGTYRIPRQFTGSGTFEFLTRTGQTLTNVAGVSNTITATIR